MARREDTLWRGYGSKDEVVKMKICIENVYAVYIAGSDRTLQTTDEKIIYK